ncbi:hypothetical protein CR203_07605 [Salipaludibacillus neizhouensis]|uniref:6-hydroxymethylpterin diphosphokinase MptE-like domain-containing protein n=1 Tax=Salipaludibacillus neizhouensis TaxID=885475 RepID=A0A3A9K701_9BACI|nr:6-hydroxymethylpterin diphosphokinase MptE-like protein [Salipaludibacillus neizhouensis]RKL68337.1 hypothetical protein CR203_07605 [Salipaludibacillus neizhouensis]
MKWKLSEAKNGQAFVELECNKGRKNYLHSRYNPEKESRRWVEGLEVNIVINKLVVVGMGMGHHIFALREKHPHLEIEVWEFNNKYKNWIENNLNNNLLRDCKISYYSSELVEEIKEQFLLKLERDDVQLVIHQPSLSAIPDSLALLRTKLVDIDYMKRSYLSNREILEENFQCNVNLNDAGINNFINNYMHRPFILVSAGPSLTKQLPLIKEIQQNSNVVVGCVGTALKPLLNSGIKPEFLMVSDPNEQIYSQTEGLDTNDLTLFYLSTASHKIVSAFKGKRYIVWQKGYKNAEKQGAFRNEPLIDTGGSVATCLLDLIVNMGASLIALVGQDLAFTDGKSHAQSTTGLREVNLEHTTIEVDNYYLTDRIQTSRNLSLYLKWFESYAKNSNFRVGYWNCTEGGAHINGWNHQSLYSFYKHIK